MAEGWWGSTTSCGVGSLYKVPRFALPRGEDGADTVVSFLPKGRTGQWGDAWGEVGKGDQQKAGGPLVPKGEEQNVEVFPSTSLTVPSWPLVGSLLWHAETYVPVSLKHSSETSLSWSSVSGCLPVHASLGCPATHSCGTCFLMYVWD